jgi:polyhydroxyalkanoate synthesis regulator phasin
MRRVQIASKLLARSAIRPPEMASEVSSGGFLERRFRMSVSDTPKRTNSRWLQACVLLCAIVALPFGVAYGQDYEAVGKRLSEAVEAGELTAPQARTMLQALKKTEGAENATAPERARAHLMKLKKELGAAVEAGKISKDDAAKKFEAAEKAIRQRLAAGRGEDGAKRLTAEDLERVGQEIRKAVNEGRISGEEGRKKMQAIRKMADQQSGRRSDTRPDWDSIKRRIEGAVERGDITREEADAKYREIKERMAGDRARGNERAGDEIEGWIKSIGERIKGAVKAGQLSEEDAWAKWLAVKEKEIAPKLKASVKAGVLSEEKAWAIWRGIEKAEIAEKLKAAVAKGELTEKEALAKWAEITEGDDDKK